MTTKVTIKNDSVEGAEHRVQVKQLSTGEISVLQPGEEKQVYVYGGMNFEISETNQPK